MTPLQDYTDEELIGKMIDFTILKINAVDGHISAVLDATDDWERAMADLIREHGATAQAFAHLGRGLRELQRRAKLRVF